ncbi:hypothetical protein Vafri_4473 [Volvox africanus]|uniref:Uncharacterized protein n=1 Tax=Volvox africanus TaxID=51714 RepID=A0A8J4AV24_9CHLO|nr:hypothetical protein Vafri_4473 [Volvox africanus]
MRKEATGRAKEMAPKVAKPVVLSAEAAAMEQKLAELRKAMEKERAKRDALMANAGGGSIWRNGGSNSGLRTNIKGKGPGEGSAASSSQSGGGPSSSRRPKSSDAPSSTRASSARTAGTESEVPSVSGNRVASARAAVNVNPPEPKGGVGGGIIGRAATGGGGGGGSAVGGMSCGTDDNPALADGAFSEADSHKSFLEALNEWRRANRGDTAAEGEGQATTTSISGVSSGPQRPHSARQSATLEVQTDSRPASRPSSAKPLSYFDKLVINTSSRVAGHLASGGPPETIRTSLSGQATGLARSPSSSRPPLAPGPNTTIATGGTKAAASVPAEMSSATTTTTATVTSTTNSSPSAAVVPADGDGVASSDGRKAPLPDPLTILDRLEALERQRQAADDDDEHEEVAIQVTTATGLVLTKGTRLPDEVLMPPNQEC